MGAVEVFDRQVALPTSELTAKQKTLLGFDQRFDQVQAQLRLLLNIGELAAWSKSHHPGKKLPICELVAEQYPLVIFHGDVGTGKTATAECIANKLVAESKVEDSTLYKLSTRVRGAGKVGEMGSLLSEAFAKVTGSVGKTRRAILIIDEADSLATMRNQGQSHHEDKVAVNTLIQCIDDMRKFGGRIVVFLCTNRVSVLDAALLRRAAVIEEFKRPGDAERRALFAMDLAGLDLTEKQIEQLVADTAERDGGPAWTYSDIRTRLYPTALARAYPTSPLTFKFLHEAATSLKASPVMEDM